MKSFKTLKFNEYVIPKILYVGIGTAGCNVIAHMTNKAIHKNNLIAIDADAKSLAQIDGVIKILIGSKLLKDAGDEMKLELEKMSAMENYDAIKSVFEDADIIFILSGLGGETGSEASPIIVQISKDTNALTIPIVTMPFEFEGKQRLLLAKNALESMKKENNSIIVFDNQKYLSVIDKELTLIDAFKTIDVILEDIVNEISSKIDNLETMHYKIIDVNYIKATILSYKYIVGNNIQYRK